MREIQDAMQPSTQILDQEQMVIWLNGDDEESRKKSSLQQQQQLREMKATKHNWWRNRSYARQLYIREEDRTLHTQNPKTLRMT